MRRQGAAFLVILLILPPLCPSQGAHAEPSGDAPVPQWSMFRGGPARVGAAAGPGPLSSEALWSFDTGGPVQSSPAIGGDMVYIGSDNGRVFAISTRTGDEVWNRSFGEYAAVQSTPCYHEGTLYIGSMNGAESGLFALNASDGAVIWSVPDDGGIAASPAYQEGRVYSCSLNGTVLALDASTGELVWASARNGEIWSSPALSGGALYGGTIKGEVFALEISDGAERWSARLDDGWMVYSTPCVYNGTVLVGASKYDARKGGRVMALNATTGSKIWELNECEGAYASVAAAGGVVYAHVWEWSERRGLLLALPFKDPDEDGLVKRAEAIWAFETDEFEGGSSPLVTDNLVVVGCTGGRVYALDRETGGLVWSFAVGEKIVGSAALFERRVIIGAMDGRVYAVGSSSELPGLRVGATLERDRLPSGTVMRINVLVTDEAGNPVEGAFVRLSVTAGSLSQSGASTFPDGSQSVKYLAPTVGRETAVALSLSAAKAGYAEGAASIEFTVVEHRSQYAGVRSQSVFNWGKYAPYLVALGLLLASNIALLALLYKRGWLEFPGRWR